MDSYYPYHRNQVMSAPYYCPSGQIGRPHLKVDPMVPCEFWPFQFGGNQGGGYAYPVPEFHGCHYQPPQPSCCAFRPPYPYAAPPHHCHGIYSAYPGSYPVHYVPPPPYFSTDQPRYEFEKNFPTTEHHHCCGCPNHSCKQSDSDKKSVKIVEHDEEDIDRKNAPQNHPYPLVLLPYGGDTRREHTKPYNEEREEAYQAKPSRDLESSEQPKNLRNGWPPLNVKRSEGMKKGEDLQTNSVQKQDDNSMSFPFPIFWMPYQPENTGKVESQESGFGQNPPDQKLASHIESMHKDEDDDKTNKSMQNEVTGNNVKKIIPVKQLEENDMKKGTSEENGAKKLSSPKKPSKLAPVCLRVDPLPRKKGSSRSPSPPGGKGKSQDMPKDSTQGDGQKDLNVGCTNSTSPSDNQIGNGGVEAPFEPEKKCPGESTQSQCDNTEGEGQIKKQLSEDEAAAVIQSAYRAYEVRKWEPLKKLKQIASVGEKMAEIRGNIQALEHSPDKLVDNKQKNVISETIMSLLLKLDTIQGLHPTVRDIRKSVARELVGLQEKLDSIPDSSPQVVTDKHTEDTMRIHQDGNVTVAQSHHDTNIMEQCEEQPLPVENSQSMVVNGQGGDNEQIDEIFGESQPTSKELEVREISEHEQCLSSPHRQTKELTYCDVEEMDGDVKDLVDLSQEEHNAQESSLPKQMDHDVKELAEVNTELSEEIITSCEDQQVTQTPPCAVDEESESESLESAQTATTGNTRMPQDEASRGLETEPLIKESIDMAEQLLPVNSNMGCEEKEVQEPKPYGITAEAQVENVGVLNEVAELLELNDNGRIEEHKEIHGSVKGEIDEDEFSSTLQQEVIMESDGSTTKVNEAEELVEVPVQKSKGAVDEDHESIDPKPRELELELEGEADDRKLEEEENVAESGSREAKETVNAIGEVENIDWSMCSEANGQEEIVPMSPTGSQISIQSEDNGRKVIEENEKLRKLLEKMIESGKEQLTTISTLSGRVKQLERKLSRRKKLKMRQCRAAHVKNDVFEVM
ncbi:PREDICTED: BAG family molecular chaperone regulator 6 isoform X2 [Ipomoea nil]|uniref:BAG family molecular chaperone regulator 6 isoform X2 n=1 Tax=Ipomoea nil TaxID=35883 RepID=UPI000900ADDC|nr:PREDICTED: BAG family molecular chaperone regulator 6 isoform X2 [Ipomoea nil]